MPYQLLGLRHLSCNETLLKIILFYRSAIWAEKASSVLCYCCT